MQDKMKAFLEAAAQDPALAEALEKAETPDAVIALAKEKGFEITAEDLASIPESGELSDELLDEVAGGITQEYRLRAARKRLIDKVYVGKLPDGVHFQDSQSGAQPQDDTVFL